MRQASLVLGLLLSVTMAACAHKSAPATAGEVGAPPAGVGSSSGIVAGSAEDFRASVGDRVFFETDQYTLNGQAREALARQAGWLQRYPETRIVVAGNCDERGTREYNLSLGARRASAVRDYLAALGVGGARVETTSYGKDRPIDVRANEEGWAVNRNAHTQLINPRIS